jgi:hypothetical protein
VPSQARICVARRSRNQRSWAVTTTQPGNSPIAFSKDTRVLCARQKRQSDVIENNSVTACNRRAVELIDPLHNGLLTDHVSSGGTIGDFETVAAFYGGSHRQLSLEPSSLGAEFVGYERDQQRNCGCPTEHQHDGEKAQPGGLIHQGKITVPGGGDRLDSELHRVDPPPSLSIG